MKHADKNHKTAKEIKKVRKYILPCFHWGFDNEVILHWNRRGPFSTKSPSLCRWSEKERGAGQQAAHLSFHICRETKMRGGIGRVVHKFSLFWGNLMALQLFFLTGLELIWGTNGCMTIHKEFALQTMNMSCIEICFLDFSIYYNITWGWAGDLPNS